MNLEIRRQYVVVDGRRVHYRRCGEGPTLILLHASPVSSQIFERHYFPEFSKHFCCIAPDTPGNGLSDPLPFADQATIDDYADALTEFLDRIDVKTCNLYGRHTGAQIAAAFAQKNPERAHFVYCDGYPVFQQEEVEDLLPEYLPSYKPDFSGGFLSKLWFRYRDQHVFWPWHKQDSDHQSNVDVPDTDFINRGVLDFLLCGDDYIAPYAAALAFGVGDTWRHMRVPTCFAIRPGDSLYGVQSRLTDLPEGCWKEELPRNTAAAVHEELKILKKNAKAAPAPSVQSPEIAADAVTPLFTAVKNGELFLRYRKCSTPTEKPLLMAPHLPGGGTGLEGLLKEHSLNRDVILFDTPGHGDSRLCDDHSIEAYSETVLSAMDELGVAQFDIFAHRTGAALGEFLKLRRPEASLTINDVIGVQAKDLATLSARYQFDLSPSWEGAHLLRLWHHLRDEQIWFPWDERTIAARRLGSKQHDLETHYKVFVDAAKQIGNYVKGWAAYFDYEVGDNVVSTTARKARLSVVD